MNTQVPNVDPDIALNIALAARQLELDVSIFILVLIKALGTPLSQPRLNRLRINRLRLCLQRQLSSAQLCCEQYPTEQLYRCIELLKGKNLPHITEQDWMVDTYIDGQMPDSIRVAFSCNHQSILDADFNSCKNFLIYQVSRQEVRLIAVRATKQRQALIAVEPGSHIHRLSSKEEWLNHRVALVADCVLLYTQNIGGPAAAQVTKAHILPMKIPQPQAIQRLLDHLQQALAAPPPWLAKAMGGHHPQPSSHSQETANAHYSFSSKSSHARCDRG